MNSGELSHLYEITYDIKYNTHAHDIEPQHQQTTPYNRLSWSTLRSPEQYAVLRSLT